MATAAHAHGEPLWFFNTLVRILTRSADSADGLSTIEHRAPHGDSPPLHIHHTEDELFYLLEGEIRFQLDRKSHVAGPGAVVLAPKGVPHTYRVESPAGARWLTVTRAGDFERFVRALARPAEHAALPTPLPPPPPEAMAELVRIATAHHIEFCGPPLS